MVMIMNNVVLVGRLTKDPYLSRTREGTAVTKFILAVDGYKDHTDFIPCQCWKKTAENVAEYCIKGSLVAVEGSLRSGSYEKNGHTIYTLDVIAGRVKFLDNRKKDQQPAVNNDDFYNEPTYDIHDDGLPF